MSALGRGGLTVGPLAFGSAPIGNLGREVTDDEWRGALAAAWDAGVRYFDTAPHYGLGLAERRLAAGLAARATGSSSPRRSAGCSRRGPATAMDDEGYAVPDHPRARPRLQPRRRPALARVQPRAARARPRRHPVRPRPRRVLPRGARGRVPGAGGAALAGRDHVLRCGDEPVRDAGRLRPRDRPRRVMLAGRYTLLEQGALDDLLPGVRAARRVGGRGRRVQLRPARAGAPARGRHVQLRAGAARDARARAPDRRRAGAPRHDACRSPRRSSRSRIRRWPPSASARAPPRRSSATRRCSTRRSPTRRGQSSSPKGCCVRRTRARWPRAEGDLLEVDGVEQELPGREGARGHAPRAARRRGARRWWARTAPASRR